MKPAGARARARGRTTTAVDAPAVQRPAWAGPALGAERRTTAATEAADLCAELTGRPWALSWTTELRIERYVASIDRIVGKPGEGRWWLLGAISDTFPEDGAVAGTAPVLGYRPGWAGPRDGGPPRSMAYFARLLRHRRRYLRKLKPPAPTPAPRSAP